MATVEPHRRFVSVELPFCVSVSSSTRTTDGHAFPQAATYRRTSDEAATDRRMVEAFVPPSFLRPCIDDIMPPERERVDHREESGDPSGKGELMNAIGIATSKEYCATEIFSGWRPLDFDTEPGGNLHCASASEGCVKLTKMVNDEEEAERERRRRESFPSTTPQLLLQGFFRNDLLVEVKTIRRVKRLRDSETGRVVKEVCVDDVTDSRSREVTVLGVVSREVDIVKPADFCFSPFTVENIESMPELCSGNIFPPGHFISEKNPCGVTLSFQSQEDRETDRLDVSGASYDCDEAPQWEFEGIPTLTVTAESPDIPPPASQAQLDTLRRLNEEQGEGGSIEVQAVNALLEERPVWVSKDLLDAIFATGLCPRTHVNRKVVACLTYVIKNGPFNRMRIRMGFNPYASPTSACLQRIAVKIWRRSELGTHVRDFSRVPYINEVLREIVDVKSHKQDSEPGSSTSKQLSSLPYRPRGTLRQRLAKAIEVGQLYFALQLVDVSDVPLFQELLTATSTSAEIPLGSRKRRCGWMSSGCYQRVVNHIVHSLTAFIHDEVEPALQRRGGIQGSVSEVRNVEGSPSVSSTSTVSRESYEDDNAESLDSLSLVDDASTHTQAEVDDDTLECRHS